MNVPLMVAEEVEFEHENLNVDVRWSSGPAIARDRFSRQQPHHDKHNVGRWHKQGKYAEIIIVLMTAHPITEIVFPPGVIEVKNTSGVIPGHPECSHV